MEQKEEYNVIWIDDEWDSIGKSFIQICEKRHNIHIKAFKTRREGMEALEQNLKFWDAVILDAKAFNNSSTNEVADVDGLYEAIKQIERLKAKRHIPYFVLTRQPDLMDDKMFGKSVGTFYKKNAEGQSKLIADLKEEVSKSTRFQIKTNYLDAIEQLNAIDSWCSEKILDILEAMHFPEKNIDPLLYYNPLRQTLEYIFRKANKASIIPDEFIGKEKDDVNLNQCVQFLSGRNADWIGIRFGGAKECVVPAHIKDMMFQILNLGNINSHSRTLNDKELKKLGVYLKENVCNSQYLIYSLALQICEIAVFMGKYIAAHNDAYVNKQQCKTFGTIEKIEGIESICVIKSKRPGRESCICISAKYSISKNLIGKKIVVLEESDNTNSSTKVAYPYFATKIELLEKENGSK
ncbi:MAG: hypothetical protein IJ580_05280 [Prevotella sp.]|nr:hypothetical protein [Prevotella sp.]